MALLEKQTDNLRRYHPNAQMWVSPQSFNQAWLDEFIEILQRQRPAWLKGVVYGPQVRVSLPRLRELVPDQYPIRHYPDITHSRQCQYPVPDWDIAYALTEGRECINPRPEGEAVIFRKTQPQTLGFLTYSEGCNDDVNKTVWSALGWDPDAKVPDILREYSRYFIGEDYAESFSQGLLALERDWRGPLLKNKSVDATLSDFRAMEKKARPADLKNWRFQQALFRAYYDAYVQHRLIFQTDQEARAMDALRGALAAKDRRSPSRSVSDPAAALDAAEKILDATVPEGTFEVPALAGPDAVPPAKAGTSTARTLAEWRTRIHELAEALFQSIGMQLSVSKYKAIGVDRGAMLDTLEYPLNNRRWLKRQFARIRSLSSEAERLAAISEIVHWTDPGPGGFYDDLGNPAQQPHLMRGLGFNGDPGAMQSPRSDWDEDLVLDEPDDRPQGPRRISWMDHAESLYDAPLQMHYTGLDPKANYKLRVVYGGDSFRRKIRLVAGEGLEIHPLMSKPFPIKPIEFPIPKAATERGELTLTWTSEPGLGGNGRNCQVSELWLLKQGASPGR
jgi:hypothetical protein